jgi:hypothetical protein
MAHDFKDLERVAFLDGVYALIFKEDGRILGGVIPDLYDYIPEADIELLNVQLAWRMGMIFPLLELGAVETNGKPN